MSKILFCVFIKIYFKLSRKKQEKTFYKIQAEILSNIIEIAWLKN